MSVLLRWICVLALFGIAVLALYQFMDLISTTPLPANATTACKVLGPIPSCPPNQTNEVITLREKILILNATCKKENPVYNILQTIEKEPIKELTADQTLNLRKRASAVVLRDCGPDLVKVFKDPNEYLDEMLNSGKQIESVYVKNETYQVVTVKVELLRPGKVLDSAMLDIDVVNMKAECREPVTWWARDWRSEVLPTSGER